jgi:hypothetical protein
LSTRPALIKKGLKDSVVGDRETISGTVYGTIIVMSILAGEAAAYEHHLWHLAGITALTSVVIWLAHVYSDGLGEGLRRGRRMTLPELGSIAARDYSIVAASILPVTVIVLGALGALGDQAAVWLALGVGAVTLAAHGVRYARVARPGGSATIVTVGANLALGLALVALEVLVAH